MKEETEATIILKKNEEVEAETPQVFVFVYFSSVGFKFFIFFLHSIEIRKILLPASV